MVKKTKTEKNKSKNNWLSQILREFKEMKEEGIEEITQVTQNPKITYTLLYAMMLLLVVVNITAVVFLYQALHRLFAIDASDLKSTMEIIAGIICALPLWKAAEYLVFSRLDLQVKANFRYRFALITNLLFLTGVVILWNTLTWFSDREMARGLTAYQQHQYSSAIRLIQHALHIKPNRADAHFQLANLYEEITHFELAREHYWQAIHLMNDPFAAYNNLARLYIREAMTETDLAALKYEEALDLLEYASHSISDGPELTEKKSLIQMAIIEKNKAWLHILLDEIDLAKQDLTAVTELLTKAVAMDKYPFVSCLNTLVMKEASAKEDGKKRLLANHCRANLANLSPLEREFVRRKID